MVHTMSHRERLLAGEIGGIGWRGCGDRDELLKMVRSGSYTSIGPTLPKAKGGAVTRSMSKQGRAGWLWDNCMS